MRVEAARTVVLGIHEKCEYCRIGACDPFDSIEPLPAAAGGIRLDTADEDRKYVIASERGAFLREAEHVDRQVRTPCMTLACVGCRLFEALALTVDRVDLAPGMLVFATLKKRQDGHYRRACPPLPCSMRST